MQERVILMGRDYKIPAIIVWVPVVAGSSVVGSIVVASSVVCSDVVGSTVVGITVVTDVVAVVKDKMLWLRD